MSYMAGSFNRVTGLDIPGLKDPHMRTIPVVPNINKLAESTRDESIKDTYDEIYELKIMESAYINNYKIMRVPGGWIFDRANGSVFVPYIDKEEQTNIKL